MFRNKETPTVTPIEDPKPIRNHPMGEVTPTLISAGAQVQGELKTPGSAVIEGKVEGTITATGDVQIGAKGDVIAEVEGRNVTVAGRVKGKIYAEDKVTLLSGSRVEGDIHSKSLRIDDNVFFEGGCVMGDGARKRRADEHIPLPSTLRQSKAA